MIDLIFNSYAMSYISD